MTTFDASIPRRMYWLSETESTSQCPECNGSLTGESCAYKILMRNNTEQGEFVGSTSGGYFCAVCPVVVLDHGRVNEMARAGMPDVTQFKAVGIVDINAQSKAAEASMEDAPVIAFLPKQTNT